ncbi:MAG: lipoprotein insertase outer membrane protein LolB [Steroidobacteraceae bacterium]|nr:lipoprotein insertase outer membrane protein LolB [Steroidobacteraceae bacterium]
MRLTLPLAAMLAAGCAAAPPLPEPVSATAEARREALQAREAWALAGRVAVAAAGEGATASLDWRQSSGSSELALRGPFGARALSVTVTGSDISLSDGEGRLDGEDAHIYLENQLGADLPVSQLRYWVLGVPAPDAPFEETAGPDGLPERLVQLGWVIVFERYRPVDGLWLPSRITAEAGTTRVRLAVSRWELP